MHYTAEKLEQRIRYPFVSEPLIKHHPVQYAAPCFAGWIHLRAHRGFHMQRVLFIMKATELLILSGSVLA